MHSTGSSDVLVYEDVPEPAVRPGQVLVRVRACSINHLDLWVRAGIPGQKLNLPHVLGSDISGEVLAVGEGCERIHLGDRVLLSPGLSCRQCFACLSGEDNRCRQYTLLGNGVPGGDQEIVSAPQYAVIPIPANLSFEEAAAVPLVFLTAWTMLFSRAKLQPGEDVLVLAASSGVGSAAIQIAKLFHCRVIATAGGEEKLAKAKQLGADEVIDHYKQDITAEVKRITGKRGVDVVIEHVGKATWQQSLSSLAVDGRLVTCGATTGYEASVDLRFLFSRRLSVYGSYMGNMADLHRVLRFVFTGKLKATIDRQFPLKDIRLAHEYVEKKQQFGKVLLIP